MFIMAHERKLLKKYMSDPRQISEDDIHVILDAFEMWLRQEWILSDDWDAVEIVWSTVRFISKAIIAFDTSLKHSSQFLRIFEYSMRHELVGKKSLKHHLSLHGHVVKEVLLDFLHPNHCNPDVVIGFLSYVFILIKSGVPHVCHSAASFVYTLNAHPTLLIPFIEDILECYLQYHHYSLAACLAVMFPLCENQILLNIAELSRNVDDLLPMEKHHVFRLYETIAKKYPQKLLPYFKFLVADFNDSLVSSASLPCLAILSDHYPDMFCEFIDKLSMIVERQPYHVHYVDKIFTNVANLNEKEARRILTNCLVQFKAVDESYYPAVFTCIKEIGVKYPKVLTNYSSAIQALGSTNGTQNYVQCLLNFLDGTSSEPDFYKIKERSQPNSAVSRIKHQSPETRQSHEVNNKPIIIKKTVPVNPQKVQSKVNKPEKTNKQGVTTAPEWCNKLSSLLNKPSDSDWRFLAVYLGYASDNIKLLSEMDNPSLCLFNDWYTSHKGREATYAVYKALQVIGRNDCMQTIDSSIPPKDPLIPENEKLIDICISYHTDDQVDANVLKFHLELAGFQCWMFTGTTLHLDTLYHVVDEAMRSADVVLCMCSRVYVNSRTCCKQANLAQQLNKPIIPVIIGPLSWPPPGPMSAIYCQFPCVQLYEFSANNQSGRKYWPHSNFVDLLAKICYHTSPNVDKITKEEYRNWIHNIESFPENSEKTSNADVFISYEWSQIEEAMVLYSVLIKFGFTCWLDVLNLGAKPIINKVDRVIRVAKVMICLLTPQYAQSTNCCREVTLATVLKLPIIPLVMEKMFWPPRGPASTTFTQLPYIDFTLEESELFYRGKKLQELYNHLKEIVPSKVVERCHEFLFTSETEFCDFSSGEVLDDFESTDDIAECGSANEEDIGESGVNNVAIGIVNDSVGGKRTETNNHDVQIDLKNGTNQDERMLTVSDENMVQNKSVMKQSQEENNLKERKVSNGLNYMNNENTNHYTSDTPQILTLEITNKEEITKPVLHQELVETDISEIPLKDMDDGKKSAVCVLL